MLLGRLDLANFDRRRGEVPEFRFKDGREVRRRVRLLRAFHARNFEVYSLKDDGFRACVHGHFPL